jgi:hypothetical protein
MRLIVPRRKHHIRSLHQAMPHETMEDVAAEYGLTADELRRANPDIGELLTGVEFVEIPLRQGDEQSGDTLDRHGRPIRKTADVAKVIGVAPLAVGAATGRPEKSPVSALSLEAMEAARLRQRATYSVRAPGAGLNEQDAAVRFEKYCAAVVARGGQMQKGPLQMNILALRDSGPASGNLGRDLYRDRLAVLFVDFHGKEWVHEYPAFLGARELKSQTTTYRRDRMPILDGFYKVELHGNRLVQMGAPQLFDAERDLQGIFNLHARQRVADSNFDLLLVWGGADPDVDPEALGRHFLQNEWDYNELMAFLRQSRRSTIFYNSITGGGLPNEVDHSDRGASPPRGGRVTQVGSWSNRLCR